MEFTDTAINEYNTKLFNSALQWFTLSHLQNTITQLIKHMPLLNLHTPSRSFYAN